MISSKSGISGMSGASRRKGFKLGVGERIHHRADVGIGKDIGANALLGHFLLVEERSLARLVGQEDVPADAGQRLERRRKLMRPVAAEGPSRLQGQLGWRIADEPDLVVKL